MACAHDPTEAQHTHHAEAGAHDRYQAHTVRDLGANAGSHGGLRGRVERSQLRQMHTAVPCGDVVCAQ